MKKTMTMCLVALFAVSAPVLASDKAAPPAEHKDGEHKDDHDKKGDKKKDHKDEHKDDHKDDHKEEKPH